MEVLSILREIDAELSNWLLFSRPDTEEEKGRARRVLFLMNRLERMRHELVLEGVKLATLQLKGDIDGLKKLNERIAQTAKDISTAKDVIDVAAASISIVVKIVGRLGV